MTTDDTDIVIASTCYVRFLSDGLAPSEAYDRTRLRLGAICQFDWDVLTFEVVQFGWAALDQGAWPEPVATAEL